MDPRAVRPGILLNLDAPAPRTFVVARNPEDDSSLPYLIRIPLGTQFLVLKARETWPRTAKVYCHRADTWPPDPEVVEEVPVRSCVRRGPAVGLTTRQARPGLRVPTRRAAGWPVLRIIVDSRERYAYKFARQHVELERVQPGFVPDLLARLQVRYPSVPTVFCDSRALAEQWTYRFLGAALAEFGTQTDPAPPSAEAD